MKLLNHMLQTDLSSLTYGLPHGSDSKKKSACNAKDLGSVRGSGISPGEGNGNPLQYSCLENFMDSADWQAIGHEVAKRWERLRD